MFNTLTEAVRRYAESQVGTNALVTEIKGLTILRSEHEKQISHLIYKPSLCITVQGAKWSMFGSSRFCYEAGQALMVGVEMPGVGGIMEAGLRRPYLGVSIELDLAALREIMAASNAPLKPSCDPGPGIFVIDLNAPLIDCVMRMVRLLSTPEAIPMISPLIMRELCYWLLTSPNGGEIAEIALANSHAQGIISAIHSLRNRFAEPVRIEEMAQLAHLSLSAFHRQFKALTLMTPLQYQKQLRLLEARRLMVTDAASVETAAFQVGYESPSQFSREYSRMFGAPPRRDVVGMRPLAT